MAQTQGQQQIIRECASVSVCVCVCVRACVCVSVRLSVFADNRLWTICGSLFPLIRLHHFREEPRAAGFPRNRKHISQHDRLLTPRTTSQNTLSSSPDDHKGRLRTLTHETLTNTTCSVLQAGVCLNRQIILGGFERYHRQKVAPPTHIQGEEFQIIEEIRSGDIWT